MINSQTTKQNPNDVFWLARYAHNQVAPLIEQGKGIEPSIHFNIQINLTDDHPVFRGNHINIGAHWDRDGMFQYSSILADKVDVDRFVTKLAADVGNLQPVAEAA